MTTSDLRIVFAGTPAFAAAHLAHLLACGLNISAVITQPDRPAGRGKQLQAGAVKQLAVQHGLPLYQPHSMNTPDARSMLAELQPDVLVVVAFGQILSQAVLDIPRFGCLNVHASLLPRWRGAAPIERAILNGDPETGVTIMQMNAGLDTGDILLSLTTPISSVDNAESVSNRLLSLGGSGLESVLRDLGTFQQGAITQEEQAATYAAKLTKAEAAIDWQQPATTIQHQVQAFYPRSPAFCLYQEHRLRVLASSVLACQTDALPGTIIALTRDAIQVACGQDCLRITHLQLPGKKPAALQDIVNGRPDFFIPGGQLMNGNPH